MTTPKQLGMVKPVGSDWISLGDNAISQNADATASMYDQILARIAAATELKDPLGLSIDLNTVKEPGLYPVRFAGNANSPGYAGFMLVGQSYNGSIEQVTQLFMGQPNAVFFRSARDGLWREWDQLATMDDVEELIRTQYTRRVLHQLSQPGNANLRDSAPSRHFRIPVKFPVDVSSSDLVLANRNEQLGVGFGDVDMAEVFVGKTLIGTFGQRTEHFDGAPTSLGVPTPIGSGATRRYPIKDISFTFKANTEYLISVGFTNPNPEPVHMGYGGSWLGTDPSMTGRYDPPVNLAWSPNTLLDVYLTLRVPSTVPVVVYADSSTLTGYGSPYPLRDNYGWKDAAARGALPVLLGQSGSTLEGWARSGRYLWNKIGSNFERADFCYIGLGSNDINLNRTVEQMKTDLGSVVALVREKIADEVGYVNIFGRASESAAVLARRAEWNEYLNTLPNRGSIAIDRTRAVEGDNRMMLPIYNSGDGTHVKENGQDQFTAAMIRGEKYTPNLNRYTVKETAGRTVTVWDYLNNREQLIYGDTGWRDISSLATGIISGAIWIRRSGNIVTIRFDDLIVADQGTTWVTWSGLISSGFRYAGLGYAYLPLSPNTPADSIGGARIDRFGKLFIYNMAGGKRARGLATWPSDDPWPSTLPGVAA